MISNCNLFYLYDCSSDNSLLNTGSVMNLAHCTFSGANLPKCDETQGSAASIYSAPKLCQTFCLC